MRRKVILVLLLCIVFLLHISPSLCQCSDVEVVDCYWLVFNRGVNSTLVVKVENTCNLDIYNLSLKLNVSRIAGEPCLVEASLNDTLKPEHSAELSFTFFVSNDSVISHYEIPVNMSYVKSGGNYTSQSTVVVTVTGEPELSVSVTPETLIKASENVVTIEVSNTGDGVARLVELVVESRSVYAHILGSNSFKLGNMNPGELRTVTLPVQVEEVSTPFMLFMSLSYEDQFRYPYTRSLSFGFQVEPPSRPVVEVSCSSSSLKPGCVNEVELTIENKGSVRALNVSCTLTPVSGLMTVIGPSQRRIGELAPASSWSLPVRVYVEPHVYGSMALNVLVTYQDDNDVSYTYMNTFGFEVEDVGEPILTVETNTTTLTPNSLSEVQLVISNVGGGDAWNVSLDVYSMPEVATVVGSSHRSFELIHANSTVATTIKLFVQPNVYGAIPVYVRLSYSDYRGSVYGFTSTIGFSVEGPPAIAVASALYTPTPVYPGDAVVVQTYIVNSGNYTARDVELQVQEVEGVVRPLYGGKARIPYLPVASSQLVVFTLEVLDTASPGYYDVPLLVMYEGKEEVTYIPLTVEEKAHLVIEECYFEPKASPGSRGVKLKVTVANRGNESASDVTLTVISGYLTGSTSTILGTIDPGCRKTVLLEVDVDPKAPVGPLAIDVQLNWLQKGRELYDTVTAYVELVEPAKLGIALWVGVAVAAIAVAVVILRRRQRLRGGAVT